MVYPNCRFSKTTLLYALFLYLLTVTTGMASQTLDDLVRQRNLIQNDIDVYEQILHPGYLILGFVQGIPIAYTPQQFGERFQQLMIENGYGQDKVIEYLRDVIQLHQTLTAEIRNNILPQLIQKRDGLNTRINSLSIIPSNRVTMTNAAPPQRSIPTRPTNPTTPSRSTGQQPQTPPPPQPSQTNPQFPTGHSIFPQEGPNLQSHPPFARNNQGLYLYGKPACTWNTEVIITDKNPDIFGRITVFPGQTQGIQVQMRDPASGFTGRYSGNQALEILVAKGYFAHDKAANSYYSTIAYQNFVRYGAPGGGFDNISTCKQAPSATLSLDGTYVWQGQYSAGTVRTITVTVQGTNVTVEETGAFALDGKRFSVSLTGGKLDTRQAASGTVSIQGDSVYGTDSHNGNSFSISGNYWIFQTSDNGKTFMLDWRASNRDAGGYYIFGKVGNEFQHGAETYSTTISR